MVVANRKEKIYYPKACERMLELQEALQQIIFENNITGRISFPITSKLNVFDGYNDIMKEYLVDFATSEDEVIVFNPEYYSVIKDFNNKYLSDIKNQKFYYLQTTLSYTSVERKQVKEDLVLGYSILNSDNFVDDWGIMVRTFTQIGREMDRNISIQFKVDSVEASIDGVMVGFGKKSHEDNIMEAHYSLTDLYTILSK